MKNFEKIISGISAIVICGCSMSCPIMVTANDGMNYVTEGIIDEAPAEVNVPIGSWYKQGEDGYEVFMAMTLALAKDGFVKDISQWDNDKIIEWNTNWGDFYGSLLEIYQNSTSQEEFDKEFFNLIGYPSDNRDWTQEQKKDYATLYQTMFWELRTKLPNIITEVAINTEPIVTTIDIITIPETTSTVTETTTNTSESVLTTTSLETTTYTETLMTTFTSTEETSISTNTSTESVTSTNSTGTNVVTTVPTSNIKNDEIPKTGDKGIFKVIGFAIGVAALCAGSFIIGKRK